MRNTAKLLAVVGMAVLFSGVLGQPARAQRRRPASRPATASAPLPDTRPAGSIPAGNPSTTSSPGDRIRRVAELNRRIDQLAKERRWSACRGLLEELIRLDGQNGTAWYNLACVDARLGHPELALDELNKALDRDYSDFRYMEHDPDLEPLRKLPGYQKLLERNDAIQRARGERIARELEERFGKGYICQTDHADKLVFASNVDQPTLQELRSALVEYAQCQWRDLFNSRLEQYVTVVVPAPSSRVTIPLGGNGYYYHPDRMLVARQIGMVLTHEFTHALHAADQDALGQRHPIWITEGLATLFESSRVENGHAIPRPNLRLNVLKGFVARKQTIPWKDFFGQDQGQFMKQAMVAYPQCRYVMMYLYDKGLLKKWYDAYVTGYDKDATGAVVIEQVFDKGLEAVEKDWLAWVSTEKSVPVALPALHAYMGVTTAEGIDGMPVVAVVPGSGADQAGLRPGDVIVRIDGLRIVDRDELIQLVDEHQVGDKLKVRFRRDGQYQVVEVTLSAMPASLVTRPSSGPNERPPRPVPRSQPARSPTSSRKAA